MFEAFAVSTGVVALGEIGDKTQLLALLLAARWRQPKPIIAGILVANIVGVSGAVRGIGLRVFPVVILGGLDSIPGAIVGGVIIGLLESFAGGYLTSGLGEVAPFVVLVLILMVRPYGLFGEVRIERV